MHSLTVPVTSQVHGASRFVHNQIHMYWNVLRYDLTSLSFAHDNDDTDGYSYERAQIKHASPCAVP